MVWNLFLAHYVGDFLLQTDWMVRRRDNFWVLTLHASIHFVMMVLMAGYSRSILWPYLLILALIHLGQDGLKIVLTRKRPDWMVPGFIIDQILHYVILLTAVQWLQTLELQISAVDRSPWVIIAIAFVLVTYVWFISERVLNLSNVDYLKNLNNTKFSRMLTRAGLVSLFLLTRTWAFPGLAFVIPAPYPQSIFRRRALLTDVSVSFFVIIFLFWALG